MNTELRSLSDSELLSRTCSLAREEQSLGLRVLEHLEEVNRRRLFAAQGYGSLFDYCVRDLGYSEPAASQRVAAMRLARDVPQAREALSNGRLPLTTAASVQRFVRREEQATGQRVTTERKRDLVEKCAGLSTREAERVLVAQASRPEVARPERARALTSGASELRFVADERLLALIERAREVHGGLPLAELFRRALETHLERTDPLRKAERAAAREEARAEGHSQRTASPAPELDRKSDAPAPPARSRHIPAPARHATHARAKGRCEWLDEKTGRRCAARHRLELDHREPFAKNGSHSPENLRLLCAQHQKFAAILAFGPEKMAPYLRS